MFLTGKIHLALSLIMRPINFVITEGDFTTGFGNDFLLNAYSQQQGCAQLYLAFFGVFSEKIFGAHP